MIKPLEDSIGDNPRVDQKLIALIEELQKKLPDFAKPKQGSDFRISHPLGGKSLMLSRRGRGI